MAKNQARPTQSTTVGYGSGEAELSNLERDVAAKNRARPATLMAAGAGAAVTVAAATHPTGSNDLYALENSISQKAAYAGMGPPATEERTPLFTNVGAPNERSMYEISRLDERIAQKSGVAPFPNLG